MASVIGFSGLEAASYTAAALVRGTSAAIGSATCGYPPG
jgi:hypothetical protein